MKAFILSVGDELVLGQTVDTNSAWISQQLSSMGCDILSHKTVGDDQTMIAEAIDDAATRVDLLIISGGIGPTADDLTRQALADVLESPLVQNDVWMAQLEEFFKNRGRVMPETNKIQAMIPQNATMLDNPAGTAAGIRASIKQGAEPAAAPVKPNSHGGAAASGLRKACEIFVVPGVPKEMKAMFELHIRPFVKQHTGGATILQRKLNTFGLGESWVAEKLGDLMKRDRNPSVGTTVADGMVSLRVNARFETLERAEHEIAQTVAACREVLGDLIFSEDETPLQEIVGGLLKSAHLEVATAESCTGGLLAKMLTDIPGSSAYFKTGFVTYSNQAKYDRLGVSFEVLNLYGAVSEPVVEAMARNALRLSKAKIALAISGIAGPDGGSPAKPVGMVCIAMAHQTPEKTVNAIARTFNFPGDREMIRDRSAKMALSMLRYHVLGKKMPF